jgi:hypothetical protein
VADPAGRFLIAFNQNTLEPNPTWTRIDSHPSLVASYTIDRGRQYELDRTDTGRATVQITDRDGLLDPTNASGPYYGWIRPLLQASIGRQNPVSGAWYTRYRGFIEDWDYVFDPNQQVNRLEVSLVDMFEFVSSVEMMPGEFGDPPPEGSEDQIQFAIANMDIRIIQALTNAHIPEEFYVVFSGNVELKAAIYSPAESVMTCIEEAADAEFPGVSNIYCDRYGRLCVHGRLAKFDPVGVASGVTSDVWEFHQWKAGDRAAVLADPPMARINRFAFNRGLAKMINQGLATPFRRNVPLTGEEMTAQLVSDATSVGLYGIRSWSAQDLITNRGLIDGSDDLTETKRFATYYVNNYKNPANRITDIAFRSERVGAAGAGELWDLLSRVDISDSVTVTVASPGGGGFDADPYFVEGVHETVQPLTGEMDDVTLTLDLSPQAYFSDTSMFPTS